MDRSEIFASHGSWSKEEVYRFPSQRDPQGAPNSAPPPPPFYFVCVLGPHEHKHILVWESPQGLQALVSSYFLFGLPVNWIIWLLFELDTTLPTYLESLVISACVIRHSRLPAGNALWVCQNFFFFFFFSFFFFFFFFSFFFFFFFFLFFRRQGFRMITFDRQAGPLQNFNRSHIMVIGRSVSFSDPARPPGGGVGRPKHPKIPPPPEK